MIPFGKFPPNKYFVETGSYLSGGIYKALATRCFEQIFSIELSSSYCALCRARFAAFPNVAVLEGDSAVLLPQLLEQTIDAPATFWLDGHYSAEDTARGKTNTPILAELESIRRHRIKNHTILIDDIRLFGSPEFYSISVEQITKLILEINQNYKVSFIDGIVSNDILLAQVP